MTPLHDHDPPDDLIRQADYERRRQRNALLDPRDPRFDDRFDCNEDEPNEEERNGGANRSR